MIRRAVGVPCRHMDHRFSLYHPRRQAFDTLTFRHRARVMLDRVLLDEIAKATRPMRSPLSPGGREREARGTRRSLSLARAAAARVAAGHAARVAELEAPGSKSERICYRS